MQQKQQWILPIPATANQPSGLSLSEDRKKCSSLIDQLPEIQSNAPEEIATANTKINEIIVAFLQFNRNPALTKSSPHKQYIDEGLSLLFFTKLSAESLLKSGKK